MTRYYDTGILIKLYTWEQASERVRSFVARRGEALLFTALHRAECVSALRLKSFRGECRQDQSDAAIAAQDEDAATGVLRRTALDWDAIWERAAILSREHAASTGCRTLDGLHVACALQAGVREFVTSDKRQASLARKTGLKAVNPLL